MSGGFSNVAAKPRSAASAASSLPGSVITAKRAGSGWRSQAQARWLRVSSVEPDLDAATSSVRSGGSSRADPGDGRGVGGVEHVQRRAPPAPDGGAAGHHLGEQAGPAHAGQQHVVDAGRPAPAHRAAVSVEAGRHVGHHRQPAEPVGDLGGVVAPEGVVAGPGPGHGVPVGQLGEGRRHGVG